MNSKHIADPKLDPQPFNKFVYQYGSHLDSALTTNELDFYRAYPDQIAFGFTGVKPEWVKKADYGIIEGTPVFPWLQDFLLGSFMVDPVVIKSTIQRISSVTADSLKIQMEAFVKDHKVDPVRDPGSMARHIQNDKSLYKAWRGKLLALTFRSEIEQEAAKKKSIMVLPSFNGLDIRKHMVILHKFPSGPVMIPYTWVLNVLDKLESYYHLLVFLSLAEHVAPYKGLKFKELSLSIYEILELCHRESGSKANDLLKNMEAICRGVILEQEKPELNDTKFLTRLLEELFEDNSVAYAYAMRIVVILRDYQKIYGIKSVIPILEQYGQEKQHWFPVASEELGLKKMYKYGTQIRPVVPETAHELRGMFVKRFVHAYFTKEGLLPPVLSIKHLHDKIQKMYTKGYCMSLKEMSKIPLSSWAELHFDKTFEFNYFPDPLDLLDDKSVAPDRSNLNQLYNIGVRKATNMLPPKSHSLRKLIDWILQTPEIDIKKWFDETQELGGIPFEESLILLLGKELENKLALRMFSVLHPKTRLKASALERNISETVFPYFQDQSMTLSGSALLSKVDTLSKLLKGKDSKWVCFHLDLTQWNYTFRESATTHLQSVLNELFGVSHFDQAMWPFRDALFVSGDQFSSPGLLGRFNTWDNYPGGNQGICQKFWTLATQLLIYIAMEQLDLSFHLIGSGDNQILYINLESSQNVTSSILSVQSSLKTWFHKIGLELKLNETWHSNSMCTYQRKYYFNGLPTNLGIKQTTKFFSGTKDGANSVQCQVETAMGSGMTLNESVLDPLVGPFLAYLECFTIICCDPRIARGFSWSDNQLLALSLAGPELGFLPILPLHSFLYSGHKDQLAETLALLRLIFEKNPHLQKIITQIMTVKYASDPKNHLLEFVLNPMKLFLKIPKTIEGRIRSAVEQDLFQPSKVKNLKIRQVFNVSTPAARTALANSLVSLNPLNMVVVHSLYELHVLGQTHASINKLTKLKSLASAMINQDPDLKEGGFSQEVTKTNRKYLRYMQQRLQSSPMIFDDFFKTSLGAAYPEYLRWAENIKWNPVCTFSLRMFMLMESWKVLPQLPVGLYCPSPLEQVDIVKSLVEESFPQSILISPAFNLPTTVTELDSTRGPFNLYVGTKTKDPVKGIKLLSLDGMDTTKTVRRLGRLLGWCHFLGDNPNLLDCISQQLNARAPGLSEFYSEAYSAVTGGTIDHRLGMPGDSMSASLTSRTLISTWFSLSTNRATTLQRGEEDRLIFYQQIFQSIFARLRFMSPHRYKMMALVNLDHCSYPVAEQKLELKCEVPHLTALEINSVKVSNLAEVALAEEIRVKEWVQWTKLEYVETKSEGLAAVIASTFVKSWRKFQLGAGEQSMGTEQMSGSVELFNISLVRQIPITLLLRSIVVSASFYKCLGFSASRRACGIRLGALAARDTGAQDAKVFRPLMEAIIVAGKLPELSAWVGFPPLWSVQEASLQSVRYLMVALTKAYRSVLERQTYTPMIVEVHRTHANFNGLHKFLLSWSPKYWRLNKRRPIEDVISVLKSWEGKSDPIHIIITSDIGIVQSRARSLATVESLSSSLLKPDYRPLPIPPLYGQAQAAPIPQVYWGNFSRYTIPELTTENRRVKRIVLPERDFPRDIVQITRWASNSSGARFKFLEALSARVTSNLGIQHIISLAEGGGSMMAAALHIWPEATGWFNTLVDPAQNTHATACGYWPVDLLCPCLVYTRVKNLPFVGETAGDLALKQTWNQVHRENEDTNPDTTLVTFDMESDANPRNAAISNMIDYLNKVPIKLLVIKMYLKDGITDLLLLVSNLTKLHYCCSITKPWSSSPRNDEVYITAEKWCKGIFDTGFTSLVEWSQSALNSINNTTPQEWFDHALTYLLWQPPYYPCVWSNPLGGSENTDQITGSEIAISQLINYVVSYISEKDFFGRRVERGMQHLTKSKSLGAKLTQEEIQGLLLLVDSLLTHLPLEQFTKSNELNLFPLKEISSSLCKKWINICSLLEEPRSKHLFFRRAGQLICEWDTVNKNSLITLMSELEELLITSSLQESLTQFNSYRDSIGSKVRRQVIQSSLLIQPVPFADFDSLLVLSKAWHTMEQVTASTNLSMLFNPSWYGPIAASYVGVPWVTDGSTLHGRVFLANRIMELESASKTCLGFVLFTQNQEPINGEYLMINWIFEAMYNCPKGSFLVYVQK
ncbi:MAG: RNA-dependent RNA polymerase [brine shrimp artovirus 1]|nr:MAG: RNA-dependent RNA polymerase [brine shrimp artovirus 1]